MNNLIIKQLPSFYSVLLYIFTSTELFLVKLSSMIFK